MTSDFHRVFRRIVHLLLNEKTNCAKGTTNHPKIKTNEEYLKSFNKHKREMRVIGCKDPDTKKLPRMEEMAFFLNHHSVTY